MDKETKYLSLTDIVKTYPFTMGQLRHFLLQRQENGLYKAVRQVGKRIIINREKFDQWIEIQFEEKEVKDA